LSSRKHKSTNTSGSAVNAKRLIAWVEKFAHVPIVVIGDLMVDRALRGVVERISPEAPVPVIDIKEETQTAGGAGNVVLNLVALGARPTLIAVRGQDSVGQQIESDLKSRGVNVSGILVDQDRQTITKTRVIAGHQQVARLDVEKRGDFSPDIVADLISKLKDTVPHNKAVIISDYGKGVITPPIIKTAITSAHRLGSPVLVDPKIEHFLQYKGVDCLTPNTKEAAEGMRTLPPKTDDEWEELGRKILKKLKSRSLLITRGEKGMMLFEKEGRITSIPTQAKEVFDVTGAGDTVVATFSLARAVGAPYNEAAQIANYAASIVVAKLGTAVASRDELVALLKNIR
jgi:rfaE bifunctional protein kinase chain/domain